MQAMILCQDLKSCLQNEAFINFIDQQGLFFTLLNLKKELPRKKIFFTKKNREHFEISF